MQKMFRPLAIFFIVFLNAFTVHAQTSSPLKKADSLFLENDDSLIVLKLSFNNEYESFTQQTEENFFDIRPNVAWMSKLSVSYRFISAAVSFKLPFIPGNEDNDKKGTTKKLSFSFGFSSGRWTQDLHLGKVKGFYLHNTADVIQDWDPDDPYFLLPGLTVYRGGGSTTFQLNRNYSFKAISTQTQRQLKSCGSPMFTALYDFYRIDNEGPPGTDRYQRSDNFEGLLSVGYYYTFVLKSHWYAGMGAMAGYGFVRSKVELHQTASVVPEESTYSNPLFQYRLQAGLGYNAGRVVAGADFTWSDATRKEADSPVRTDMRQFFLHFFVGYKFGAPGILRKSTDKAADIIPLLK